MKCGNEHCVRGLEPVQILLDTPEETRLLAEHFPNRRPHIQTAWWPCRYCNHEMYELYRRRHEALQQQPRDYVSRNAL